MEGREDNLAGLLAGRARTALDEVPTEDLLSWDGAI